MSIKTVGVVGGTIYGNRGAEAMLATSIGKVRELYPEANIKVFSYYPEKDRALIKKEGIEILNCKPLYLALLFVPLSFLRLSVLPEVKALKSCDLFLDIAGISFADGRKIFLLFNVFSILPAIFLKVPVVKCAQALGPFKSKTNRLVSSYFLPKMEKLYARGEETLKHLEDIELPENRYELSADLAFLFEPKFSLSEENGSKVDRAVSSIKEHPRADKVAAIVPSSLLDSQKPEYLKTIEAVCQKLIEEGYLVTLVPNATREGFDGPRNNDLYTIDKLVKLKSLDPQNLVAIDFDINTEGTRRLIELSSVVVTSRFHGLISTLSLKKPVLVLGWSHKYREVMKSFDIENYSTPATGTIETILGKLDQLLMDLDSVQEKIESNINKVKKLAARQFEGLN